MRNSLLAITMVLAFPLVATAATLNVNSTADTLVAGDGQCTLREAILNANGDTDSTAGDCAAGSGADEIHVPAGRYLLAIPGADENLGLTGDLDLTDDVAVIGAGAGVTVIDAGGLDRVMHAGSQTRLEGLTLTGGVADGNGGGILASDDLTVVASAISGNRATGTWLFSLGGGGIAASGGDLTVVASVISENESTVYGGGIGHDGWPNKVLALDQTTVSQNHAGTGGGGIYSCCSVSLRNSTVSGNYSSEGRLGCCLATFASGGGGGLYLSGSVSLQNSTVSGNTAKTCRRATGPGDENDIGGAAIYFDDYSAYDAIQSFSLENSTIADNECLNEFVPREDRLPSALLFSLGYMGYVTDVSVRASVLRNPANPNCVVRYDSYVDWSTAGHNISSDGSCGLTAPTDLSNVDPMLGPLQDNGGPTQTHALLAGSPAIDRIPSADCTWDHDDDPAMPEVALNKDQRGGWRPREGDGAAPNGCDVGAYEVQACADGIDNDSDGFIDFDGGVTAGLDPPGSPDPHCTSALDNRERPRPPTSGCGIGPELALLLPGLWWLRRRRGQPTV